MSLPSTHRSDGYTRSRRGFTLIEILVALLIFSMILIVTYNILDITIRTEKSVTEATLYGEIGQAILTQMRRDLQGVAYRDVGRNVFRGNDQGDGENAEDSMHFLTMAPVPPPDKDFSGEWDGSIASVGYVLKDNRGTLTLFRRVNWTHIENELGSEGSYFPIYEKVQSLSIRYYDGREWYDEWDSTIHPFEDEKKNPAKDLDADGESPIGDGSGTPLDGANNSAGNSNSGSSTDDDSLDQEKNWEELPIPRSIEITLSIFLGNETGLIQTSEGKPLIEKYVMIVPLIACERIFLNPEISGAGGDLGGTNTPPR